MKEHNHKHNPISSHSPQQRAMFFALASELGHPTELIKKRAIKYAEVECFNDIPTRVLSELVDKLNTRIESKLQEEATKARAPLA